MRTQMTLDAAVALLRTLIDAKHYQEALMGLLSLAGVAHADILSLRLDEFVVGNRTVLPVRLSRARSRLKSNELTNQFDISHLAKEAVPTLQTQSLDRDNVYFFRCRTTRWMQLRFKDVQKAMGISANAVATLRQMNETGRSGLTSDSPIREDLLSACRTAAMLVARRIPLETDRDDAIQNAALDVLRAGSKVSPSNGCGQLPNIVADFAIKNHARSKRNRCVLIPHYKWISGDVVHVASPVIGLKCVHAGRLNKIAEQVVSSFTGREKSIVRAILGLGHSRRPSTTWEVAKRFGVSAAFVGRIETEVSKRAARLNRRSPVVLLTETKHTYKRSVAYALETEHRQQFWD